MEQQYFDLNDSEKLFKKFYLENKAGFLGEPLDISQYKTLIECYPMLPDFRENIVFDSFSSILKMGQGKDRVNIVRNERYVYAVKHSHDFIEILYVYQGKCRHYVNDSYVDHTAGDICIISPHVWHCTALLTDESICFSIQIEKNFFFSGYAPGIYGDDVLSRFINQVLTQNMSGMYLLFKTGELCPFNVLIMSMYRESVNRRLYSEDILLLDLNRLFLLIIRDYSDKSLCTPSYNTNIQDNLYEMLDYMHLHYADITLQVMADKFNYNKEYLSRFFKLYTGKTFSELLQNIKLRNARDLLLYTAMSITDVGYASGFYDLSHFNRCFKSYYGISPKQMRKNAENNN